MTRNKCKRTKHRDDDNTTSYPILGDPSRGDAISYPSPGDAASYPSPGDAANCDMTNGLVRVASFRLALRDTARHRGTAKVCTIVVRVLHKIASVHETTHVMHIKVDARKSFSNLAFKRYYTREAYGSQTFDAGDDSVLRTVLCLSQCEASSSPTKSFVGVKRDRSHVSSKHPLLCVGSDTLSYKLDVLVDVGIAPVIRIHAHAEFPAGCVTLERRVLHNDALSSSHPLTSSTSTLIPSLADTSLKHVATDEQLELSPTWSFTSECFECADMPSHTTQPHPRCEFMN
jgi:hypothetical protein